MEELKLISPIPPSVNHYLCPRIVYKNKKPMVVMFETTEAKKFKKSLREYIIEEVKKQGFVSSRDKRQHWRVNAWFYFDRIDRDCNNYWKLLLDAITETEQVWVDDNTVCESVQGIWYDKVNPRIELLIFPVQYVGIFDNREEKESFEDKCKSCKKYCNGKCRLLKESIEGRINPEVVNKDCTKFIER